ncbi:DHA1 family bicyclomycin/chloramphenicol resistance-like MFS transporter [Winogradskyella epiphytica]|uniref:DHA1 family bicyclomycin/chloramphenicol resistance-like MFS transporter n=1 Tax=Winogradskyella epiphytica TaxID=262005 RepID=A0A2V4X5E9_9FLAO|nr:multidrug effflux MFS transporter [Winogradskyella epiphytica]PYE80294.1 DHA1 family bicyclomycin/chloramphenicol resistance-like MFS transporter [Winogradskyella epiphytica]GGW70354.1 Bcr/CflA family drug resistance efflux transporter [Winogradskyella epiphytica]
MQNQKRSQLEFVTLMAALMSIVALSIDAVLPALPEIGDYLNSLGDTENQKLITAIFLGLGFGQLVFGPLSDSFGRKPMVYFGFGVFVLASIICITTKNFEVMLFGRVLQGVGLSSPRTMSVAIVRDSFSGDHMAKVLSIVTMTFILVPVIAPMLGQFLLIHFGWKSIFTVNLAFGLLIIIWFWRRQPETLKDDHQKSFRLSLFLSGAVTFFRLKSSVIYTLLSGLATGSFMVYLSTSQQIFQVQYDLGEYFPYIFASLAVTIGLATFLNSAIVMRFGMWNLVNIALLSFVTISLIYVVLFWSGVNPPIEVLMAFLMLQFTSIAFLFGNYRALAMQPMGHIAGIGSALNGFISTVMAVPIANYIGSFVTTSVLPLFIGFLITGVIALILFYSVKKPIRIKA